MHFHTWVEYKEIKDGTVNYYRICKRCGRCQKWKFGAYFDTNEKKSDTWIEVDYEEDFLSDLQK